MKILEEYTLGMARRRGKHHLIRPASDRQARWLGAIIGRRIVVRGVSPTKARNVLRGYHYRGKQRCRRRGTRL